jgi:hypothetical protein
MKISDIVKGTDVNSRIVKYRHSRTARRRAELLDSMARDAKELWSMSRGAVSAEGLDIESAVNEVVQAVRRLKSAFSG